MVCLPRAEYEKYDQIKGNGQSRLLQAVKNSVLTSYPRSDIHADGQVVKIAFADGMNFEILPAFQNKDFLNRWDGTYVYPDANMGGNWKSTNPKAEQQAMRIKNQSSKGLLNDTCKHIRKIRDNYFSSYHLSGIVIDSFVYRSLDSWAWCEPGVSSITPRGTYEQQLLEKFNQMAFSSRLSYGNKFLLYAPGSNQLVDGTDSMATLGKVLNYIAK